MSVQYFLNTFIFMKACIIHDNHAFIFKAWNQCVFASVIKYIAIDILLKVIKRKKYLFIESIDEVSSLFCLSIVTINITFASWCIAVSDGVSLKTALIHINN